MYAERLEALLNNGAQWLPTETEQEALGKTSLMTRFRGERKRLHIQDIVDATAKAFHLHLITEDSPVVDMRNDDTPSHVIEIFNLLRTNQGQPEAPFLHMEFIVNLEFSKLRITGMGNEAFFPIGDFDETTILDEEAMARAILNTVRQT